MSLRSKKRKRKRVEILLSNAAIKERTYQDYLKYSNEKSINAVQIDTVLGQKGSKKCLLTMFIPAASLTLLFLMNAKNTDCVKKVFDDLEQRLGAKNFKKLFPVLLADRGSEFMKPKEICSSIFSGERTKIFYCDPNAPFQKANLEKNHTLIRKVFPKKNKSFGVSGTFNTFDNMTQKDIDILASHINSYTRKLLNGKSPLDIARFIYGPKQVMDLNLQSIPPQSILLKPELLHNVKAQKTKSYPN